MPTGGNDDDDTILTHGPLSYWLKYEISPHGLKGWWILLGVAAVAFVVGKLV